MGRGKKSSGRRAGGKKRKSKASLTGLLERRRTREARELVARARTAARAPLHDCLVNDGWEGEGLAAICLARRRAPDKLAIAHLVVDLHGIGVRQAEVSFSVGPEEHAAWVASCDVRLASIEPALALAIVHAGRAWGRSLDFPEPDTLPAALCLFGDIEPAPVEIPCGVDGRPRYVLGPHDDLADVVERLRRAVGHDGFDVVVFDEAFDRDEVDEFREFLDHCILPRPDGLPGPQHEILVAFAATVWNLAELVESPAEIVSMLFPDVDERFRATLEAYVRVLYERRLQEFGAADFLATPEIQLLASLDRREQLYWT